MDDLIGRLAGGLAPVRPRRPAREYALLAALVAAEAAALALTGATRGDLAALPLTALAKMLAPALLAVAAVVVAVRAGDPSRPRPGTALPVLAAAAAAVALLSAALAVAGGAPPLLRPAEGLACMLTAAALALPPALALGVVLARAAPVHPWRAAIAAAIAAGGFGAALLGLHCPDDGAVHSFVWHTLAVVTPAVAAVLPIARAARW